MESLVKDLLKQNFKDSNTKISKDALKVYCHYLELFVREGAARAAHQAQQENSKTIEFEHLEQIFSYMPSTLELWSYSLFSTFIVSIIPILFLFLVPLLQSNKTAGHLSVSGRWVNWFLCFAAGALIGDAFLHLISGHDHGSEHSHSHDNGNGLAILAGISIFFAIELLSPASNCNHSHSHKKSDDSDKQEPGVNGMLSLIADSIHNFTDGLTIAAAWASSYSVGISTTIAIFLHEIPHELGDYAVLSKAGYNHAQILKCQFMTAGSAFAGTLLGLFLQSAKNSSTFHAAFKAILPFSAGGFIYLALASIVPEILRNKEKCRKQNLLMFAVFLMGILLMTILD